MFNLFLLMRVNIQTQAINFDLIAEHINKEIELPKAVGDPRETLITLSLEIRRVLLRTRDAVEVLEASFPTTPSRIKAIKFMLDTLTAYGVSNKNCLTAANLINNYVLSFVADEIRGQDISPVEAKQFGMIFGE